MIQTVDTQELYSKERAALNERNDCTVRAIASGLRIPYKEAHTLAKHVGREHRRGMRTFQIEDVLAGQLLGFNRKTSCEFLQKADWNKRACPTVAQVMRMPKFQTGVHMLLVKGHAFTVKDGIIFGNYCEGARCRVTGYYTIETGIIDTDHV